MAFAYFKPPFFRCWILVATEIMHVQGSCHEGSGLHAGNLDIGSSTETGGLRAYLRLL
jgi:hypothetical protein